MNICIVSEYYAPDNFIINDITAALTAMGHRVEVLTGLPDYTTSKIPKEYKGFRRRREILNGAAVRRVPTIARRSGVFFRILSYTSFAFHGALHAKFGKKPKADVIFVFGVSPVFQIWPAAVYQKRLKKPLILYCMDLWPESMKAWNVKEKSLTFKIVKKISQTLYRRCDRILITSAPFRDYLTEILGIDGSAMQELPQYADDQFGGICGCYLEDQCVDFVFAGNIGAVQDVACIIRAAARVSADSPFKVHIIGDGSELARCKELAQRTGVSERILFYGRRPLSDMPAFYKLADCFLLTLRGGDFIGMTLPGKAQGYLSAGKPVICAADGAANALIRQADCGLAGPSGDDAVLAANMEALIARPAEYREKGLNGRRFYETHYTKEIFLRKLLTAFDTESASE